MKVFKNLSITTLAMLLTLPVMSMHHEEGTKDPMMKNMMTPYATVCACGHKQTIPVAFLLRLLKRKPGDLTRTMM